ncbi:Crp/Fnr family transcriptional regulator [Sphingobacterium sp. DR205]|uniref:Crp/Fnr family transcriptional regulator n=1 Tax=Sphingobacterium sp. DR205 TaxID=2713573 RepID=UPI0013E47856|nr:Crp/Fnr family transcriptional regulator [Sphingobacterium sp. DR205]QIH33053.1 Crp/Fnr family transcriptional regulator [Sphingobacterium sp. DR205]
MLSIEQAYAGILEPALIEEITQIAQIRTFHEGDLIIDTDQYIRAMPLLLEGAIKVVREDEAKGELLLYYLEQGQTCTMSIACCMGNKKSEIRAWAEKDTTVAMIPNEQVNNWMGKYSSWRNFIISSYANRMNEMLQAVDNLAFSNMEERIVNYLQAKVNLRNDRILTLTHQDIASDLNTSRVVVSRILKKLENEDKIVLLRNEIRVLR